MFHTFSPSNHYEVHEFSGEVINWLNLSGIEKKEKVIIVIFSLIKKNQDIDLILSLINDRI
jgi:hypothetical protein